MVLSNSFFLVTAGLPLIYLWTTPSLREVGLLIGAGALAGFAQFTLFEGMKRAQASVIAPFEYTSLVWAFLLGYLIWHDVPRTGVFVGAAPDPQGRPADRCQRAFPPATDVSRRKKIQKIGAGVEPSTGPARFDAARVVPPPTYPSDPCLTQSRPQGRLFLLGFFFGSEPLQAAPGHRTAIARDRRPPCPPRGAAVSRIRPSARPAGSCSRGASTIPECVQRGVRNVSAMPASTAARKPARLALVAAIW